MKKHKTLSDKIDNINKKVQVKVDSLLAINEQKKLSVDRLIYKGYTEVLKYAGKRLSYSEMYGIYTFSFEGRLKDYSVLIVPTDKIGIDKQYKFTEESNSGGIITTITLNTLEKELMKWLEMIAKNEGVGK